MYFKQQLNQRTENGGSTFIPPFGMVQMNKNGQYYTGAIDHGEFQQE
jgi:hypothetical protein